MGARDHDLLLRFGCKLLEVVLAAKLDGKLNLLIFERLINLPIEFFERQQAGQTAHQIGQVHHVREFLTGKLMNTFIDVFMVVLLPSPRHETPSCSPSHQSRSGPTRNWPCSGTRRRRHAEIRWRR